jgi:site-specific recombinase XerD
MMLGILGLRSGSIVSLNVQDIDTLSGLAWVKEKGARKRIMVLPEMICRLLQKYLEKMGRSRKALRPWGRIKLSCLNVRKSSLKTAVF